MAVSPVRELPRPAATMSINFWKLPAKSERHAVLFHHHPIELEDGCWEWDQREIILMPLHGLLSQNLTVFKRLPCCNANLAAAFDSGALIPPDWVHPIYLFGTVFVERPWGEVVLALFKVGEKWEKRYVSLREPAALNAVTAVFRF